MPLSNSSSFLGALREAGEDWEAREIGVDPGKAQRGGGAGGIRAARRRWEEEEDAARPRNPAGGKPSAGPRAAGAGASSKFT